MARAAGKAVSGDLVGAGIEIAGAALDPFGFGRGIIHIVGDRLKLAPTLEDDVVVEVVGQPGTSKQQLYFLALATANGIVRRFGNLVSTSSPYGKLSLTYDAHSNWVRASISYRFGMAALAADRAGPGAPIVGSLIDRMAVYRGPQCDVVGGNFDFVASMADVPGIPASAKSPAAPVLPLEGQPIITACPTTPTPVPRPITQNPVPSVPLGAVGPVIASPNPKPPGDNRSRGAVIGRPTVFEAVGGAPIPGPVPTADKAKCCDKLKLLIPLVFSALTSPATDANMRYAAPTAGPTGA